ncbi:probable RNA polymerase II nuclear localization protein SLC7A6OS [Harpegnathos saltator]|uniref:Probable RNA polymerase II nuclear localization protein SLC7A6OS n=1 Tax=Harpegnathos saltator TaxID=610380 RepID=E2C1Z1_HARSA|nr:probable RNA polymerase II nuclear localization protein SLC7A6OS [Harpegnathos saltator]EFN78028.1 hypothetical protein EAI_06416 [Harpegnathos saltator]
MATVLRVKRKNSVLPQDALILRKRSKLADDGDDEAVYSDSVPTLAKFAGTVKGPEENVLQHLAKTLNKEELKASFKQPPSVNFLAQRRKQTREKSAEDRYKVINHHRSLDISNIKEFEDKVMTVIDVEDSASPTVNHNIAAPVEEEEKDSDYVYDVYYAENCNSIDDSVSVHSLTEHEIVYDQSTDDCYENEHDSEDSNAESYYQNSYPNTDYSDDESVNENDMRAAIKDMENCHLSSDDEYENNGDDENEACSLDMRDVEMHGYKYARYKQRMKPLLDGDDDVEVNDHNTDNSNSSSDEEIYPWNSNGSLVYGFNNWKNA